MERVASLSFENSAPLASASAGISANNPAGSLQVVAFGAQSPGKAARVREATDDDEFRCVGLVPVVASENWDRHRSQPRSTSIFVTHLMATAEHVPQTRSLRRGTAADAQNAYSAHQHQAPRAGIRTRQII